MDLAKYCVDAVLVEGRSVRAVALATGRSKSWVQRHVALYREGGEGALVPRKRGPKVPANLTAAVLEDKIVAWRKRLAEDGLDAGARTIAWHLSQEGAEVPALSTIHRVLRRRGFVVPQPQKRPRSSWMRFESDLPNETWQSDMTHWHLDDEAPVEIINFIDDHSRAVLASVAVPVATAPEVVRIFFETTAIYGFPASVLSDNGAIYTAAYRGAHSGMEIELATLGITFKHGKPYHPAVSRGVRKKLGELLRWFHESKGGAGSVVEACGDAGEVPGAQDRQVGALRHVLAQEAVRVLVRTALPGTVGVTEVDLDTGVDGEIDVAVHLLALVPGDGPEQLLGQFVDGSAHSGIHLSREATVREVKEHHVAG